MKSAIVNSSEFQNLQNRLATMKWRAQHLCGLWNGEPIGKVVSAALEELHAANLDEAKRAERMEFLERASKDPKTAQELCALRVMQANNYMLADLNIASFFFQVINLANDERPVFQNNTKQNVKVMYTGGDTGPRQLTKVVQVQSEELLKLRWLATEEVRIRKIDIYHGDVTQAAESTLMMSYDWQNKVDQLCFDLINSGDVFGAFNFTTQRVATAVGVLNPRINKKNLPTTNDIQVSNAVGGKFGFACLKAALKYEAGFGQAFMEGSPKLTGRILIPGLDVTDIADEVQPTGQKQNSVAEQIAEKGWSTIEFLGRNFILQQDNTLEPGVCYFETNMKPGVIFLKPGLASEEKREGDYEMRQRNEEWRYMKQPFGAYVNATWRPRALRIRYRKAA